jgi:hypothetical protein
MLCAVQVGVFPQVSPSSSLSWQIFIHRFLHRKQETLGSVDLDLDLNQIRYIDFKTYEIRLRTEHFSHFSVPKYFPSIRPLRQGTEFHIHIKQRTNGKRRVKSKHCPNCMCCSIVVNDIVTYCTRCNRGFYCRSYCLLNMFRAPLCP